MTTIQMNRSILKKLFKEAYLSLVFLLKHWNRIGKIQGQKKSMTTYWKKMQLDEWTKKFYLHTEGP